MNKAIVWSIPSKFSATQEDFETFKSFEVHACALDQAHAFPSEKPKAIKIALQDAGFFAKKLVPFLSDYSGALVVDIQTKEALEGLGPFIPYADLFVLNLKIAQCICLSALKSYDDIKAMGAALLSLGAKSVLIKGGHLEDHLFSQDYWTNGKEAFWLASQRHHTPSSGAASALSAAITACLALGHSLEDALVIAKMYVGRGVRRARPGPQEGQAQFFHQGFPEEECDIPYVSKSPMREVPLPFPSCELGLYPIVDTSLWLERLLPLGLKCIQLRIKDGPKHQLEKEIKRSVDLARRYGANLFINDYWELALRYGATGVHLGQEDLPNADIAKIRAAGIHLGLSTYCYFEMAKAYAYSPSYMACGPIYQTHSKAMSVGPFGIPQLKRWRRTLNCPLVAIGGINLERLPKILDCHVEGIAVISAITQADDPEGETQIFLSEIARFR